VANFSQSVELLLMSI